MFVRLDVQGLEDSEAHRLTVRRMFGLPGPGGPITVVSMSSQKIIPWEESSHLGTAHGSFEFGGQVLEFGSEGHYHRCRSVVSL